MDCSTFEDTIVAPATVPGTGAVTMIRVSGRDALGIVGKVVSCPGGQVESAPANTIRYGLVRSEDGQVLDEVMVSVFRHLVRTPEKTLLKSPAMPLPTSRPSS